MKKFNLNRYSTLEMGLTKKIYRLAVLFKVRLITLAFDAVR